MSGRILIPTDSPNDWQRFLAEPQKQWRDGYSAKSTALHWEKANGLPEDIADVLGKAGINNPELLLAVPEWKTSLPGGRRESQTDVFALVKSDGGLVVCAIEAKVAEPFGPTVADWLKNASDGKLLRLDFLKDILGLSGDVGNLRYQLLHRTASAIIEAKNFNASIATMIVQSFHPTALWREDLEIFSQSLGVKIGAMGKLKSGESVLLAWSSPPLP